jgi:hypothetical protein
MWGTGARWGWGRKEKEEQNAKHGRGGREARACTNRLEERVENDQARRKGKGKKRRYMCQWNSDSNAQLHKRHTDPWWSRWVKIFVVALSSSYMDINAEPSTYQL